MDGTSSFYSIKRSFQQYSRVLTFQTLQLVDSRDYLVAHYNFKPADKPAYSTSGNVLTIYEAYGHLALGEFSLS